MRGGFLVLEWERATRRDAENGSSCSRSPSCQLPRHSRCIEVPCGASTASPRVSRSQPSSTLAHSRANADNLAVVSVPPLRPDLRRAHSTIATNGAKTRRHVRYDRSSSVSSAMLSSARTSPSTVETRDRSGSWHCDPAAENLESSRTTRPHQRTRTARARPGVGRCGRGHPLDRRHGARRAVLESPHLRRRARHSRRRGRPAFPMPAPSLSISSPPRPRSPGEGPSCHRHANGPSSEVLRMTTLRRHEPGPNGWT